jgi:hypothetical protein
MAAGRIENFDGGRGSGNSLIPHINSSMPAMLYRTLHAASLTAPYDHECIPG